MAKAYKERSCKAFGPSVHHKQMADTMDNKMKVQRAALRLQRASISEIAKEAKLTRSVTSKYLYILGGEGKITLEEVKPYKYWNYVGGK